MGIDFKETNLFELQKLREPIDSPCAFRWPVCRSLIKDDLSIGLEFI